MYWKIYMKRKDDLKMKARTFNIMQYEVHPETGEPLLNEDTIKIALAHKSIKRWAYIAHDKDVYSERDEADNPDHKAGDVKPKHWHIVCWCQGAVEISVIARWFGIPENFIDVPKGQGAFLDCVEYLTHEHENQQLLGKRLYPDEEVHASIGFNFREEINQRIENKLKYGKDLSPIEQLRYDVLYNGMSLAEAKMKSPFDFMNDISTLEKHRHRYINRYMPMPKVRINIYIEGPGGIGKGLMSRALAHQLANPDGDLLDDEVYFEVGASKTTFEGYDGQPVIIWNDCRAETLLDKLGDRENVFNVFDTHPPKIAQNIKYDSVVLKNSINIINSVQSWSKFVETLSGEYTNKTGKHPAEDASQSQRRFPLFMVLHEKDLDLGINKGVFFGTREYDQYVITRGIQGNAKRIFTQCGDNKSLRKRQFKKMLEPVKDGYEGVEKQLNATQTKTDEEIEEEFKDYGTGGETVIIQTDSKGSVVKEIPVSSVEELSMSEIKERENDSSREHLDTDTGEVINLETDG